jgi:hypothetical protein
MGLMTPIVFPFGSAQGTPVRWFSWDITDRVGERSRTRSVADRQYPTPMTSMSPLALPFGSAQGTPVFGFSWDITDRVGERSRIPPQ